MNSKHQAAPTHFIHYRHFGGCSWCHTNTMCSGLWHWGAHYLQCYLSMITTVQQMEDQNFTMWYSFTLKGSLELAGSWSMLTLLVRLTLTAIPLSLSFHRAYLLKTAQRSSGPRILVCSVKTLQVNLTSHLIV